VGGGGKKVQGKLLEICTRW